MKYGRGYRVLYRMIFDLTLHLINTTDSSRYLYCVTTYECNLINYYINNSTSSNIPPQFKNENIPICVFVGMTCYILMLSINKNYGMLITN